MKTTKVPRRRGKPPPLSPAESSAVIQARRLNLYLLFEGQAGHRTWRIFSKTTGRDIGWWAEARGQFRVGGRSGATADVGEVLRLAAER